MISDRAKNAKTDAFSSPSDIFAFWMPVEIGRDCTGKPERYAILHDRSLGFTVVGVWFHDFGCFHEVFSRGWRIRRCENGSRNGNGS